MFLKKISSILKPVSPKIFSYLPMHILYVDQHFKTPEEGGAIRSYHLARGLVDAGHQVTLISGHAGPKHKKVFIDGIHVHYLPVPYSSRMSRLGRSRALLRFVWMVCRKATLFQEADVCYITVTQPPLGLVGLYFQRKFSMPFYAEVHETTLNPPFPSPRKLFARLDRQIYQKARALVALSPDMEQRLRQIAPRQLIHLIPEVADCRFFSRSARSEYHERQFGVAGKFVVTHFGPLAPAHHLDSLIEAARACQQKQLNDVLFLLVGEGSEQERLQAYAEQGQLNNLQFVPHQNKYGLLSVLNVTDAVYISLADHPARQNRSPTEFFEALAAGKLSITNRRGWIADLMEENRCGFYASPQQPYDFVTQLAPFVNDRQRLDTYQANARDLGERQFEREKQIDALLNSLEIPHPTFQGVKADTLPV